MPPPPRSAEPPSEYGGEAEDLYGRRGRPYAPSPEDWRLWAIRGGISSKSIFYWEYLTQNGYRGSLSEFLNHSVEILFAKHDLFPAMVNKKYIEKLGLTPVSMSG